MAKLTQPGIRREPAYHDGFFDAQRGDPLFSGASDAYRAGWEAFYLLAAILVNAGFERKGNQFSKTTVIGRATPNNTEER